MLLISETDYYIYQLVLYKRSYRLKSLYWPDANAADRGPVTGEILNNLINDIFIIQLLSYSIFTFDWTSAQYS